MSLPMELDPIQRLNPKQQLAVRYYTDPLMPTFGNAEASAQRAGYGTSEPLRTDDVKAAIVHIQQERAVASTKTVQYMESYAMDAARELVRQLGTGKDLDMLDPVQFLGIEVDEEGSYVKDNLSKEQVGQIAAINNHNKIVLQAVKERRAAAELLIAYKAGTPEQRVKIQNATHSDDVPDLGDWTKEELQALAEEVAARRAALDPMVLEAEEDGE